MHMRLGFLILAVFLMVPFGTMAQGIDGAIAPQNKLVVDSSHPRPGEMVKISIDDYAGGAFGSQISWRYNGETIPNSTNQRSIEVEAGSLGSTGVVEAVLTSSFAGVQTLSARISPIYLDIIIEPQTRVPSWYQGRAMPSLGSQINVTALVNDGSIIDPAGLVYTWQINQKVLDAGPVRGRNKMSFDTPRGRDMILSLSVSRSTGDVIASKAMRIQSVSPVMKFYEKHSLYGARQYPINTNLPLIGNAVTILAEPYFLDTRVYNNPDVSQWEINGLQTDNGTRNPYEITLQRAAASGQTNLNFHVRSLQEVLQGDEANITINF